MAYQLKGKAVRELRLPTVNYDNTPIKTISAQQGDANARFFSLRLFDDRGDIDLAPYSGVILYTTFSDGSIQTTAGEIDKRENVVHVTLDSSLLTEPGKVLCNVSLTGEDAGKQIQLTSQPFYMYVTKSISSSLDGSEVKSSNEYKALEELYQKVAALQEAIETSLNTIPCQLVVKNGETEIAGVQLLLVKEG